MQPDYGESPDLLEFRAKLAAARASKRGALATMLTKRRDAAVRHAAFMALFYDGEKLRPGAEIVLDDLAEAAGFGAASPVLDHAELCFLEGKRWLLLHLLSRFRLSPERAAELQSQLENSR